MLGFVNTYLIGILLPILLILSGGIFFVVLRGFPLTRPSLLLSSLLGKENREARRGMVTALAGTLGVGNITGVACAIRAGGAGAVFWMWISAFSVMLIKYAEILLACRYREKRAGGEMVGSAYLYIKNGLKSPLVASLFALLLLLSSFAVGNMTQTSAASETALDSFGIPPLFSGILLALLLLVILSGGGRGIMRFANRLLPPLTLVFCLLSFAVILLRADRLWEVFRSILQSAFTPRAGVSGVLGYLTMESLRLGTARGIFSNEAGCGTAPIAHASTDRPPVIQGMFGIAEVLVDTILLCSLTAFVILLSGGDKAGLDGTPLAIESFSFVLGGWVKPILSISVVLYALASAVTWGYYGETALLSLCKQKTAVWFYRLFYASCSILGALLRMDLVYALTDLFIGLMTLVNLLCLLALRYEVRKEGDGFLSCCHLAKKRRFWSWERG